jgi:hypothetical protein
LCLDFVTLVSSITRPEQAEAPGPWPFVLLAAQSKFLIAIHLDIVEVQDSAEVRTTQIKAAAWTTQLAAILLQFR